MTGRLAGVSLLAAGVAVGCAVRAEPPRPEYFARHVEHGFKQGGIEDIAAALHIERYGGQVELNSGFSKVRLGIEAFKTGQRIDLPGAEGDLLVDAETNSTLRYAVHIIDLDFLRLGDAKKNHCRMRFTLRGPEGETVALERDIAKDVIDLLHISNIAFDERAATSGEVPLFWFKQGGVVPGPRVASKDEVVEKWTKDGSVLIVSLRFGDAKKPGGK
jgi:hypothetical protein